MTLPYSVKENQFNRNPSQAQYIRQNHKRHKRINEEIEEKIQEAKDTAKELENEGYEFEGAEGSLELLMLRAGHSYESVFTMFDRIDYRILTEKRKLDPNPVSEATVTVEVGGKVEHTAAWGNGPVNALDRALRTVLPKYFPGKGLENIRLLDYKVRVLTAKDGTAAKVRVLIESGDGKSKWGTVGVSENVIEASWQALVDSIEYKLLRAKRKS